VTAATSTDDRPARKPQCTGTRKDGARCRSTFTDSSGLCAVHSGKLDTVAAGRKGGRGKKGWKRQLREAVRRRLDADAEHVIDLLMEAGKADWRALAALIDIGYGRPAQAATIELGGTGGEPVRVEHAERLTLGAVMALARELGTDGVDEQPPLELEAGKP
jgi:hypothetical protein